MKCVTWKLFELGLDPCSITRNVAQHFVDVRSLPFGTALTATHAAYATAPSHCFEEGDEGEETAERRELVLRDDA